VVFGGRRYKEVWYIKNSKGESTIGRVGDKPAEKEYQRNGNLKKETWFKNGIIGRDGDKPAIIDSNLIGGIRKEWHTDGKIGRALDKAAIIYFNEHGAIHVKEWYMHGMIGRLGDKPAKILFNEDGDIEEKEWLFTGHPFRKDEDKPTNEIYKDGELIRQEWKNRYRETHRPWKPAIINIKQARVYDDIHAMSGTLEAKYEYWWRGKRFSSAEAFQARMDSPGFIEPRYQSLLRDFAEQDELSSGMSKSDKDVEDVNETRSALLYKIQDDYADQNEAELERLRATYPEDEGNFVAHRAL